MTSRVVPGAPVRGEVDGGRPPASHLLPMTERRPPEPDVTACRAGEQLDAAAVGRYLAGHKEDLEHVEGTPEVWQFPGGHANLTYLIHYPRAKIGRASCRESVWSEVSGV